MPNVDIHVRCTVHTACNWENYVHWKLCSFNKAFIVMRIALCFEYNRRHFWHFMEKTRNTKTKKVFSWGGYYSSRMYPFPFNSSLKYLPLKLLKVMLKVAYEVHFSVTFSPSYSISTKIQDGDQPPFCLRHWNPHPLYRLPYLSSKN